MEFTKGVYWSPVNTCSEMLYAPSWLINQQDHLFFHILRAHVKNSRWSGSQHTCSKITTTQVASEQVRLGSHVMVRLYEQCNSTRILKVIPLSKRYYTGVYCLPLYYILLVCIVWPHNESRHQNNNSRICMFGKGSSTYHLPVKLFNGLTLQTYGFRIPTYYGTL